MRVLTVATHPSPCLDRLLVSGRDLGLDIEVLGMGIPFLGGGLKLVLLLEAVQNMPADELVLFVDAYDVVFLSPAEEIERKYGVFAPALLAGADQLFEIEAPSLHHRRQLWARYPAGKPFRFLDAGTLLAPASVMLATLASLDLNPQSFSARSPMNRLYLRDPSALRLDHRHQLFTSTGGRTGLEETDYEVVDGRLRNLQTGTTPCVLHATRHNQVGLNALLHRLGKSHLSVDLAPWQERHYQTEQGVSRRVNRTLRDNYLHGELSELVKDLAKYSALAAGGAVGYIVWRRWFSFPYGPVKPGEHLLHGTEPATCSRDPR